MKRAMISRCAWIAGLSLACGAIVSPATAADENEAVLGKLGNAQVMSSEIRRLANFQGPDVKRQLSDSLLDLDRLVRNELIRKSLATEAREKGWDKKPEVQFLLERAKEQALITAYVQRFAQPPADFPSEDLVKAAYEQNKATLVMPSQYQIATIFVAAPPESDKAKSEAAAKKIADIEQRLRKDPNQFAQVAKDFSEAKSTAAKGGEMGWVTEKQIVPDARAALETMEKGAVSAPIKGRTGWTFIRLLDKKPAKQRTLEESRRLLVATLRVRKMQENERAYLEGMLQKAPITINDGELARLQATLAK